MPATPQSILDDAQCSVCTGAMTLFQAMEIGILRNILTGLGETMTQAEINEASACFVCLGLSLAEANILVLLNAVADAGGGGGGTSNNGGVVDPEGVVSGTQWQWYTNTANQTYWQKQSPGTGTTGWQQVV